MAFHKILVALDNSNSAENIFVQAIDLAHREESELLLFSCVQWAPSLYKDSLSGLGTIPEQDFSALDLEITQIELKKTKDRLEGYKQRAQQANVKASTVYNAGEPGFLICQHAKSWGAELILVGRRGRSGLTELMLGSVSSYVMHRAHCSVLVIQGDLPTID
jgi:nucleotide-binding universal stress UspA family protein